MNRVLFSYTISTFFLAHLKQFSTYPVLGFPIVDARIDELLSFLLVDSSDRENRCVSFSDAHVLVTGKEKKEFAQCLRQFYWNLADGKPIVWIAKAKGATKIQRCFGPAFFEACLRKTASTEIRHFFCGGKSDEVLRQLKKTTSRKFKNQHIVGIFAPNFCAVEEYDYPTIAEKINKSKADFVWIGLSSPKQQEFALYLSRHTNVRYLFAVGAAFDYHSNPSIRYAPAWLQTIGMEWCFRLYLEPKRLWRRYAKVIPKFIFYALKDFIFPQ